MIVSLFYLFAVHIHLVRCAPEYVTRNLKTIQSIYDLTVYPQNVPIIQQGGSAVPSGLFNSNAAGRITPLGNFTGFEDSIEYFFGLAPVPQSNPAGVAIYKAEIAEFTSGCANVATSVVYLHAGEVDQATGGLKPGAKSVPLKQVAFWRFDDDGLVLKYDAWIPTLQNWISTATGIDYNSPLVQTGAVATTICPTIQKNCQGEYQQYSNVVDCIAQLTLKPFGTFDEVWDDNVVCRIIHLLLTPIRPNVHCPHVGPNGGNGPDNYKCVNIDYVQGYFLDDAKLFGSTFDTFSCPST
ncbi:hypothetical protein V5O48_010956 [Marasmius crinis-equi]|uniref:Uncharacterized protein n=1 Tax=Marasmius crinis-equi TaxID=585013 RepID=A0ABR3F7E0_9AGAR